MCSKILRLLIGFIVVLIPATVAQAMLYLYHGATFNQIIPIWSDEIFYWHQAVSFGKAGLNSGYYTVAEIPANFAFSHYHSWGIFIPMFYGTLGRLFNWSLSFIPILNLLILTLSVAAFLYVVRATLLQSILLGVLLGTFIPFLINSISSGIPLLQQSIALGMAAGFYWMIHNRESRTTVPTIGLGGLIIFACCMRIWWGIFLIPYVLLLLPDYKLWRVVGAVAFAGIILLIMAWVVTSTGGPYPYWYSPVFETSGTPHTIFENLQKNLSLFNEGNVLEIWLRRQYLTLIGLLGIAAALLIFKRDRWVQGLEIALCGYTLIAILAAVVLLYDVAEWRDYRILSPIMLFVLAFLMVQRRYWIVLIILAMNLWLIPEGLKVYDIWSGWHVDSQKRNAYYAWEAEMQKVMVYDSDAPNPWCNTVLHSQRYLFGPTSTLLAVDSGLGLSSPLFLETYRLPFRSRYLMLDDKTYAKREDVLHTQSLMVIPDGQLYLNLDSDCPLPYSPPS